MTKTTFKLWGRTYDSKLKDLQKQAGIKKVVTEAESLQHPNYRSYKSWQDACKKAGLDLKNMIDDGNGGASFRTKSGKLVAQYDDENGGWVDPKAGSRVENG